MSDTDVKACPACGVPVTLPRAEPRELDGGMVHAMVVTDPGTFHAHLRDAHPEEWAQACDMQRKMNANPRVGILPRKVNGTIMRPGEDVGDLP